MIYITLEEFNTRNTDQAKLELFELAVVSKSKMLE